MDTKAIHRAAKIAAEITLLPPFSLYSHSIVRSDDNALNPKRKIFSSRRKTDSPIRQKFALLISNGNFCASKSAGSQLLSASIGRFSECVEHANRAVAGKKAVSADASGPQQPLGTHELDGFRHVLVRNFP